MSKNSLGTSIYLQSGWTETDDLVERLSTLAKCGWVNHNFTLFELQDKTTSVYISSLSCVPFPIGREVFKGKLNPKPSGKKIIFEDHTGKYEEKNKKYYITAARILAEFYPDYTFLVHDQVRFEQIWPPIYRENRSHQTIWLLRGCNTTSFPEPEKIDKICNRCQEKIKGQVEVVGSFDCATIQFSGVPCKCDDIEFSQSIPVQNAVFMIAGPIAFGLLPSAND